MKKLISVAFFLPLATYLILSLVLQNSTFPTKLQTGYTNEKLQKVNFFLEGGEKINALYNKKENTKDVILYFHGNVGRLPYIIDYLADSEYSFIAPSYSGYNGSSGSPSVTNVYEVAIKIMPVLQEIFGKEINLHIFAHSLGSQPAVYFASQFNGFAKTLVVVGGFDSVYSLCKVRLKVFSPACIVAKNSFNAIKNTPFLKLKLFIFHHVNDSVIPISLGRKLFENLQANQKDFISFEEGNHGYFDIESMIQKSIR